MASAVCPVRSHRKGTVVRNGTSVIGGVNYHGFLCRPAIGEVDDDGVLDVKASVRNVLSFIDTCLEENGCNLDRVLLRLEERRRCLEALAQSEPRAPRDLTKARNRRAAHRVSVGTPPAIAAARGTVR